MGWVREDAREGCEGYVVALVHGLNQDGKELHGLYRSLSYPLDDERRQDIRRLAAGCECGWRSPRWRPLEPARWMPFCVFASERDEDRALDAWRDHAVPTAKP